MMSAKNSDNWICHMCTYMNEIIHFKCKMCDCPRHRSRKSSMEYVIDVKEQEDIMLVKNGDDWKCYKCTYINNAISCTCEICKSPRSKAIKSSMEYETGMNGWSCSTCSYQNFGDGNVCSICSHTTGWICKHCTLRNNDKNRTCEVCKAVRDLKNYGKLQEQADYIITKNHDPTMLFKNLAVICEQLKNGNKKARTLWITSERVQNR